MQQLGNETISFNIDSMIQTDGDPFDFLNDRHIERRVDSVMREEAALTILQFGI